MPTRINRENFLRRLEEVSPGLSHTVTSEQSDCLVFRKGKVLTFNREVACRTNSGLPDEFRCAVTAKPFIEYLRKLGDQEISLEMRGDRLAVTAKHKGSDTRMDREVALPVGVVEQPEGWKRLPEDFQDAVALVQPCVSKDDFLNVLTCIHVHPDHLEGSDNMQLCRFRLKTGFPRSVLVKGEGFRHVLTMGPTHFSLTKNWAHFKSPSGLVMSFNVFEGDYPIWDSSLVLKGRSVVLPANLDEAVARAQVYSAENQDANLVRVELRPGKMRLEGEGGWGRAWEFKSVQYKGPRVRFRVAPDLLSHLAKHHSVCQVCPGDRLKVSGEKFDLLICLEKETKNDPKPKEE